MKKTAVILFNLGGPDNLQAVQPFLYNLFSDPAIIRLPFPLRQFVAKLISTRRAKIAAEIYEKLGGRSPILPNTEVQKNALEQSLNSIGGEDTYKVFIAMRYWHPMTDETAREVKNYNPDEIILLPLYPQFSTTTTASSLGAWHEEARAINLNKPTRTVCCYAEEEGFITAATNKIRPAYDAAKTHGAPRILFSAHGLPEKIVKAGDPYAHQCEQTVAAIQRKLSVSGLDSVLCYQSRVGPLKWIGPATEDEIKRAGADRVPTIIVPIAFVSEHSETLVELGMEYRKLANECGVPFYEVVPTVSDSADFIDGLKKLVIKAGQEKTGCVINEKSSCRCAGFKACPCGRT